jgi:hypothetical protein
MGKKDHPLSNLGMDFQEKCKYEPLVVLTRLDELDRPEGLTEEEIKLFQLATRPALGLIKREGAVRKWLDKVSKAIQVRGERIVAASMRPDADLGAWRRCCSGRLYPHVRS